MSEGVVTSNSLDQYTDSSKFGFQHSVRILRCTAEKPSTRRKKHIYSYDLFAHLRELIIDLPWDRFTLSLFQAFSPVRQQTHSLRLLKTQVGLPNDCYVLGEALRCLPCLETLTITDIPDEDEFMDEAVPFLGRCLRTCTASLRHLDLSLTNPNRPRSWEPDLFVFPHPLDYHFNILFPAPSDEERMLARKDLLWNPSNRPWFWKP